MFLLLHYLLIFIVTKKVLIDPFRFSYILIHFTHAKLYF